MCSEAFRQKPSQRCSTSTAQGFTSPGPGTASMNATCSQTGLSRHTHPTSPRGNQMLNKVMPIHGGSIMQLLHSKALGPRLTLGLAGCRIVPSTRAGQHPSRLSCGFPGAFSGLKTSQDFVTATLHSLFSIPRPCSVPSGLPRSLTGAQARS